MDPVRNGCTLRAPRVRTIHAPPHLTCLPTPRSPVSFLGRGGDSAGRMRNSFLFVLLQCTPGPGQCTKLCVRITAGTGQGMGRVGEQDRTLSRRRMGKRSQPKQLCLPSNLARVLSWWFHGNCPADSGQGLRGHLAPPGPAVAGGGTHLVRPGSGSPSL